MNKETTNQEELLQQKDQRIAELEKENEQLKTLDLIEEVEE